MMRYLKLLALYLVRAAFVRDACELIRFYRRGGADVIFACTVPVDEQWVRTSAAECRRRDVRCATVLASFRSHGAADRRRFDFCISPLALPVLRAGVMITSSTGFPRCLRPTGCESLVHMPHSLVSLHAVYPDGTFDRYDALLCCGPHHVKELARMDELAGRTPRKAFPVGYGKMDLMRQRYDRAGGWGRGGPDRPPMVLIAPSWGVDNILEAIGVQLVAALLEEGYRVVVRPHPMAFAERRDLMDAVRGRFADCERFDLEPPTREPVSMLTASVVISDHSGAAFEYAFLCERPALFVDVPARNLNPNWRQFKLAPMEAAGREKVGIVVPPEVAAVVDGVRRLLAEAGQWRPHIRQAREEYLFNPAGCAAPAADAVEELLASVPKGGGGRKRRW